MSDDQAHDGNTRSRRNTLRSMLALPIGVAVAASISEANAKTPAVDPIAARLDVLESKDQITELLYAYARANDRADEALMRSCFWPESTHKHGGFDGKSSDFVGFAFKIVSALKWAAHHISNATIEVRGDRALSECYYFAHHRRDRKEGGGEEDALFEGRYIDDLERRNGVWKIIRRRGISDYSTVLPAEKPYAEWPAGQHSLKAPDDDYYTMLARFRSGGR